MLIRLIFGIITLIPMNALCQLSLLKYEKKLAIHVFNIQINEERLLISPINFHTNTSIAKEERLFSHGKAIRAPKSYDRALRACEVLSNKSDQKWQLPSESIVKSIFNDVNFYHYMQSEIKKWKLFFGDYFEYYKLLPDQFSFFWTNERYNSNKFIAFSFKEERSFPISKSNLLGYFCVKRI